MIDYSNTIIQFLAVHEVGNQTNEEELRLSKDIIETRDEKMTDLLHKYFLTSFVSHELYKFTFSNDDFTLNPLYSFAVDIFNDTESFFTNSVNIAKHLYQTAVHPQIKSGDLFVVLFSNIMVEEEKTNAIGIFKSENRQEFLKLDKSNKEFIIKYDDGINISKLDKGCLIYNLKKDKGFMVSIVDKSNRLTEAQYWKDTFLNLKPCSDDFQYTKEFMNIAKNFVAKQLKEEFEVSRTDQIDLLNKSVEYFKSNETFNKEDFEEQIFQNEEVIKSFRNFDEAYRHENDIEIKSNFEISEQAVKKQAKVFKSVLKLDKNFHIYIHGDRNLIEQGADSNGKYYKIYFEKEQ